MARSKRAEQKIRLTQDDLDRFHRNAPAALLRRGPSYQWEESVAGLQTVLYGAVPIVGLFFWDWSAVEMMVFLLAGAWVGILCDTAKVLLLRKRAEAFAASMYDDWHVWVVVGALRDGTRQAYPSHLRAKWAPMAGVFVDYVMGGASTLIILAMLISEVGLTRDDLLARGLLASLAAFTLLRVVETIWEIIQHRAGAAGDRPVKAAVGLRGVGLFLLVFVIAILVGDDNQADPRVVWIAMLIVNSLVVLVGLANLTGPIWLGPETRWLRRYLDDRAAQRAT